MTPFFEVAAFHKRSIKTFGHFVCANIFVINLADFRGKLPLSTEKRAAAF